MLQTHKRNRSKKKIVHLLTGYLCFICSFGLIAAYITYSFFGTEKLFDLSFTTAVVVFIMTIAIGTKIILLYKVSNNLVSFYTSTVIRFIGLLTSLLYFRIYYKNNLHLIMIWCTILYFLTLIYDTIYVERRLKYV